MKKTFDCVEMKRTIQEKQMEEFAGLSDQERTAQIQREIRQNKKFAKFLSKTPSSQTVTH